MLRNKLMKKVLIFFANGTEEVEALTPLDYLRRAGAEVTLVGICGEYQTGSHGITVKTDATIDDIDEKTDFDMIVIPGGMPGTNNIESSEKVQSLITRAHNENKFIGAICAAPKILGARGLLKGKTATCYPGFEDQLDGAAVSENKAVKDGNIITGTGAGAANEFALMLISALYGTETAEKIGRSVRFYIQ